MTRSVAMIVLRVAVHEARDVERQAEETLAIVDVSDDGAWEAQLRDVLGERAVH